RSESRASTPIRRAAQRRSLPTRPGTFRLHPHSVGTDHRPCSGRAGDRPSGTATQAPDAASTPTPHAHATGTFPGREVRRGRSSYLDLHVGKPAVAADVDPLNPQPATVDDPVELAVDNLGQLLGVDF